MSLTSHDWPPRRARPIPEQDLAEHLAHRANESQRPELPVHAQAQPANAPAERTEPAWLAWLTPARFWRLYTAGVVCALLGAWVLLS